MPKKIYKVIQWSSGNVGKASIRGIKNRSDLDLVGLIVSDKNKNGLDAGTIAGIDPIGVEASTDIKEVLSTEADCVNYTPLASLRLGEDPDLDKKNIIMIIKNSISTSDFNEQLYKMLSEDTDDSDFEDDLCLITNQKLKPNFIKLSCGHKFNGNL